MMSQITRNVYVDELFDSYCASDILPYFGNYKDAKARNKEITESMGCLHAALDYLAIDRKDQNTFVLVIGDGKYPRTGVIFAFFTSWNIISIDPMLDIRWEKAHNVYKETIGRPVQRLTLRPVKFEEFSMTQIPSRKALNEINLIVVLPHSHVDFEVMITKMASCGNENLEYSVVSLPCCIKTPEKLYSKRALDKFAFMRYNDTQILSDKREMFIFPRLSKELYEDLVRRKK
jgi:hypothetical protein